MQPLPLRSPQTSGGVFQDNSQAPHVTSLIDCVAQRIPVGCCLRIGSSTAGATNLNVFETFDVIQRRSALPRGRAFCITCQTDDGMHAVWQTRLFRVVPAGNRPAYLASLMVAARCRSTVAIEDQLKKLVVHDHFPE